MTLKLAPPAIVAAMAFFSEVASSAQPPRQPENADTTDPLVSLLCALTQTCTPDTPQTDDDGVVNSKN